MKRENLPKIIILTTIILMVILVSAQTGMVEKTTSVNGGTIAGITGKVVTITGGAISGFSSFVDFVKSKISGRSTTNSFNLNISVPNSQPQVEWVATISDQSITEGGRKSVDISFIVYDQDGYTTITSANASIRNATGGERRNQTCQKTNSIGTKEQNFTCEIGIWYFDNPGIWNITIIALDHLNASGTNQTTSLTLLETTGMVTSPATISWATLAPGNTNKTPQQNLQINNTANKEIKAGNVSINATNLVGDTYSSYALYVSNFSVGIINATNTSACGETTSTKLERYVYKSIEGANLSVGNYSVGDGRGQANIYLCLRYVGQEIVAQNYTTTGEGQWIVKIQ